MSIDHAAWMANIEYWWDILNWNGIVVVVLNVAFGWASFRILSLLSNMKTSK